MHKRIIVFVLAVLGCTMVGEAQTSRIDSLSDVLQQSAQDTQKVNVLSELSKSYLTSDPRATLRYAKQALALSDSLIYPNGQTDAFLNIGRAYAALANYDRALEILEKALAIAQSIGYQAGIFGALNAIGLSYGSAGSYVSAVRSLTNALEVAQRMGSKERQAMVYVNLGMVYFLQDNYVSSLKNYLAGIEIFEDQHDLPKLATAYLNVGSVAAAQSNFDEASVYYDSALHLFEKLGNERSVAQANYGLGKINLEEKNYTAAEQRLGMALAKAINSEDQALRANVLNDFGNLAYYRNDFQRALNYYQRALSIQQEIGVQPGVASSLVSIGKVYRTQGRYNTAIRFAQDGLNIAQRIGTLLTAQEAAHVLYESHQALAQYQPALNYYKTYTQYKDSLTSVRSAKEIQRLQFERALEKRETENDLLKTQADWQARQVALQKKILNFLILGCVLLAAIIFLLLRSRRREKQASIEITRQRDALEEANRSKNKLFSVISHDLRSPLNSLQGLFSLLQDGHLSSEELQIMLPELTQRLGQTHNLLDNLLIWSKSQMKGIRAHPAKINLVPLIQNTLELVTSRAEHKQIRMEIDVPVTLTAYADSEMVTIVLRNLLTNAIKFTGEQGTIRIIGRQQTDFIKLSVEDTGVGISDEVRGMLFADDTASTVGTRGEKGTGLGLLLSRDFVEKNGGTIWVESQMKLGSKFTFTIPASEDVFRKNTLPENR